MHRETITGVDDLTAARITRLWNDAIGNMLEGLRTDLHYLQSEATLPDEELKILEETERTLCRLDSGEQHGGPTEARDAVHAWLAYYFRSAEEPTGMNLAPVYRLAAELSDLAEVADQKVMAAAVNDPWTTT
ncbi:hypothetical protein ACIP4X_13935 [Streptomyces sp. NPDC088817]|uniref:hypothetical protein n=1 Tax=Streptomyces sp. NPDC088817 TaxID=3365907 RepID=UPI00381648B6